MSRKFIFQAQFSAKKSSMPIVDKTKTILKV